MSVIEEEGGRLNAFAKEPKIEVVNQKGSYGNIFWLLIIAFIGLLAGLISFTMSMS